MENVIKVLEELEDESCRSWISSSSMPAPADVGGIFAAENGYVARARIQRLRKYLPVSCNRLQDAGDPERLEWTERLEYAPVMSLAGSVEEAMRLMNEIDAICDRLPQLDCGSCGAPTCRALAEDVVRGLARESDCIFRMRQEIQEIASRLVRIEGARPPGERPSGEKKGGNAVVTVKEMADKLQLETLVPGTAAVR